MSVFWRTEQPWPENPFCQVKSDFCDIAYIDDEYRVLTTIADQYSAAIERSQLFEDVKQLAMSDPLTGLYKRRYFFELSQHAVEHAARYSRSISVLMIDIDRFKKVNDTYGHAAGDVVLQTIARLCHSNMRKADILGRYGGEEFAIVLPETGLTEARQVADRLRRNIAALQIQTDAGLISITASLGGGGIGGCLFAGEPARPRRPGIV